VLRLGRMVEPLKEEMHWLRISMRSLLMIQMRQDSSMESLEDQMQSFF